MAVPPAAEPFSAHPLTFPASSRAALMALPRQAAETLNISFSMENIHPLSKTLLCPGSQLAVEPQAVFVVVWAGAKECSKDKSP